MLVVLQQLGMTYRKNRLVGFRRMGLVMEQIKQANLKAENLKYINPFYSGRSNGIVIREKSQ